MRLNRKLVRISFFIIFLICRLHAFAQVTITIESIPSATPTSDTIFVCGTFNNWRTDDPAFMVRRQLNGQMSVAIPSLDSVEYKFTRGSWTKVETDRDNKYTANRKWRKGETADVYVTIDNWLDLGGARRFNYLIFYFFAAAFQGFALTLLLYRFHKKEGLRFKSIVGLNALLIIAFLLLVISEFSNQLWRGYLTFLFFTFLFAWGPLLDAFYQSFHHQKLSKGSTFIPASIVLMVSILFFITPSTLNFLTLPVTTLLSVADVVFVVTGIFHAAYFHWRVSKGINLASGFSTREPRTKLIQLIVWCSWLALATVPATVIFLAWNTRHPFLENFHPIAITLSLILIVQTYYLWRYPLLLKEEKVQPGGVQNAPELMMKVDRFMQEQKPFRNPELSVSDLADLLGTKAHILSRLLNDNYQKNFRDFVNEYRIAEFIRLADSKEFKHYTFLALAQEVGFNSKSTFNLAFKKHTNQSPREYFKTREIS